MGSLEVVEQPGLTVIVPCFNELATIAVILDRLRVALAKVDHELIVVDDGSTDGTPEIAVDALGNRGRLIRRRANSGKTTAVREALQVANGEYVIIQDADLEYDPNDIPTLLATALATDAAAVYGRRPSHWSRPSRWILAGGVLFVDAVIMGLYGRFVRDHATCYKLIRRDLLLAMDLQTSGFEGCVEMTCKLLRMRANIVQMPIRYHPRRYADGKKLRWTHGIAAVAEAWRCRNWTAPEPSTRFPDRSSPNVDP